MTIERAQQSIADSKKPAPVIHFRGKSYSVEEACTLAIMMFSQRDLQAAADIYHDIIAKVPGHTDSYNNLGNVLQMMMRYEDALARYNQAIALKPDYAEAYFNQGCLLQKMKRYEDALASYDQAIALKPDYANAYNNRGIILIDTGDMREAEKMFLQALALKPDFSIPIYSLTRIRKYQNPDHDDVKTIHMLLARPTITQSDKEYLYFSLAKIYDDCRLYDKAFECYKQANQISNGAVSYNAEGLTETIGHIIDVFSKDFLTERSATFSTNESPIFIVGMPRSGTTLMTSIVSNHPSVATAGELSTITEFTSRLSELTANATPYPQAVKYLTPAYASRLINDYEKRLRRDIGSDAPYMIDKYPLNFWHLGLIVKLFPDARIIHCTRHPFDIALSNYFQRFSASYDYSFDLQNIGHFYGEYRRIMKHWRQVLPAKMLEIRYEDMILHTEATVRKSLDFLGLAWNECCLTPHTNPCAIETASGWQVRQPIYTQSVERWQHYEKHLAPLHKMLQTQP